MKYRLAVIPARSGSKRLHDKNILPFMDQSLLARKVNLLVQMQLFDYVWVSTDSKEYAEIALDAGAACPVLRKEANDDFTSVSVATTRALEQAQEYYQFSFRYVYQFMPNCPLVTPSTIKDFIDKFESSSSPSAISFFDYGWANPYWAHRINSQGQPEPILDKYIYKRSQDLGEVYCPSGAIWGANCSDLLFTESFYMNGWSLIKIPRIDATDIDTEEDYQLALILAQGSQNSL